MTRVRRVALVATPSLTVVAWALSRLARLVADTVDAVTVPGPAGAAEVLTLLAFSLALSILLLLAAWAGLACLTTALSALPGAFGRRFGRLSNRLAPAFLRRAVVLVLGSAMAGLVAPSTAGAGQYATQQSYAQRQAQPPSQSLSAADAPDRLSASAPAADELPDPSFDALARHAVDHPADWVPARPPTVRRMAQADVGLLSRPPAAGSVVEEHVVVHRGDTLWDITARHLGSRATAADIAREWPRWYAANARLIGADPHLIRPGQRLLPPASAGSADPCRTAQHPPSGSAERLRSGARPARPARPASVARPAEAGHR